MLTGFQNWFPGAGPVWLFFLQHPTFPGLHASSLRLQRGCWNLFFTCPQVEQIRQTRVLNLIHGEISEWQLNWMTWRDELMRQCVFCILWKVWHDFPSAGFSKERRLRLIPHCQGVPCFELNPFLRSIHICWPPKKVNPPPCVHSRYPGFPGARAGQAGPRGEWIAGINTSQLTMMMMMANTWRKALWLRESSGGFSRASKVDT